MVQVPPTLAAIVIVAVALNLSAAKVTDKSQSNWDRLKRIDFTGAFFLAVTILSLCLILDLGESRLPWTSPWIFALIGTTFASTLCFVASAKYAAEPIFPLELATHFVVVTNYLVIILQTTAQSALMVCVPHVLPSNSSSDDITSRHLSRARIRRKYARWPCRWSLDQA